MSKVLFALAIIGIAAGVWGKVPGVMPVAVVLRALSVVVSIATDHEPVQKKVTPTKTTISRPAHGEKVKKSA